MDMYTLLQLRLHACKNWFTHLDARSNNFGTMYICLHLYSIAPLHPPGVHAHAATCNTVGMVRRGVLSPTNTEARDRERSSDERRDCAEHAGRPLHAGWSCLAGKTIEVIPGC